MGLKKLVKKAASAVVGAVANAPETLARTTKEFAKSTVSAQKSLVGANGGNYFDGVKDSAADLGASLANNALTNMTMGTSSLNDKGNNIDAQIGSIIPKGGGDLAAPGALSLDAAAEDPNLIAERENARKKGRASNILGGGADSLSAASAKKTLLAL